MRPRTPGADGGVANAPARAFERVHRLARRIPRGLQRTRLETEGVRFLENGIVPIENLPIDAAAGVEARIRMDTDLTGTRGGPNFPERRASVGSTVQRGTRVPVWLAIPVLVAVFPAAVLAWTDPSILARAALAGAAAALGIVVGTLIWSDRRLRHLEAVRKALGSEVAALERKVREQSEALNVARTIDETTGILKRAAFLDRFAEALARDARLEKPLALLLLDIEGFRKINEEHGRGVGDEALAGVARSLKSATRGTDVVGRLGEDELAVVLGECADPRPAIDRLFLTLDGLRVGEGKVHVRAAIGAALVEDPQEGWDLAEIVREAEVAVNAVRGKGGGISETRRLRRERVRSIRA